MREKCLIALLPKCPPKIFFFQRDLLFLVLIILLIHLLFLVDFSVSYDIQFFFFIYQSFSNGCFSNATFTKKNGVIFGSAAKYLNDSLKFGFLANNRIYEPTTCTGSKIHRKLC